MNVRAEFLGFAQNDSRDKFLLAIVCVIADEIVAGSRVGA